MSEVWLVTGIPGAGKTTIARLLASRFERSVHLGFDELQSRETVTARASIR